MKMPDITPAQILALISTAGGLIVSYGLLSSSKEQLIVSLASIALPGILMIGDSIIRHGRSKINVAMIEAEALQAMQLVKHQHELNVIAMKGNAPSPSPSTAAPPAAA